MVPIIESVIPILEESLGPIVEDPLHRESAAPDAEVDIPSASLEMTTPTVWTEDPTMPVVDSLMEPVPVADSHYGGYDHFAYVGG